MSLLRRAKAGLRKYGLVALTSFQNSLVYTANYLFDIAFYAFILFILLRLWTTVYSSGTGISGYSLQQMVWYCVVTEMIMLSRGSVFSDLSAEIKSGGVAYLLNKPFNYLLYQLANTAGTVLPRLLTNAVFGVALGLIYVGPLHGFPLVVLPAVLTSAVMALTLNTLVLACLGLTALWVEENAAFSWIYVKLVFMLGMFAPVELFPGWLRRITMALPFSYITYGPAKLAVDFSMQRFMNTAGVQLAYVGAFFVLALLIYRKGVRALNVNGG